MNARGGGKGAGAAAQQAGRECMMEEGNRGEWELADELPFASCLLPSNLAVSRIPACEEGAATWTAGRRRKVRLARQDIQRG